MTCSERRRIAFLAGELAPAEAEAFDTHLLTCEACWTAVQDDRAGRAALERLRTPVPHGLAEKIALGVELASRDGAAPRHRHARLDRPPLRFRRAAVAAVLAMLAAAGSLAGALAATSTPGDPPMVAAVVALAGRHEAAGALPRHLRLDGLDVALRHFRYHGTTTLVAISTTPFAMPPASHVVAGSNHRVWMASRGSMGLYCVNAPSGRHSMLAVASMPAVALPSALARAGLGAT